MASDYTYLNGKKGVWRTIKGRHIFIEEGQSLSDALRQKEKNDIKQYNKKLDNIEEYNLYKQARENPDSIDPMTENSTDWIELDNKYGDKYYQEIKKDGSLIKGSGSLKHPSLKTKKQYEPNDWYETKDGLLTVMKSKSDKHIVFNNETGEYLATNDLTPNMINKFKDYHSKEYQTARLNIQDADDISKKYPGVFKEEVPEHIKASESQLKRLNTEYKDVADLRDEYEDKVLSDKYYFGKEQYEKYGDVLSKKYAGTNISKKIADADKPNGLRTIAKEIGAKDEYEVVEALEGMSRNSKAREIDDSTYSIIGAETVPKFKEGQRVLNNGRETTILQVKNDARYGPEYLVRGDEGNVWTTNVKKLEKLTDEQDIANRIRKGKMNKSGNTIWNDFAEYNLGSEKEGYYVQFQDIKSHQHEDIRKYPHVSPKTKSSTWARVWRDGHLIYAKEGESKYGARANVAKFIEGEKSYSTLVQSYMNAGFSKLQAEALAKYQLRRRK